MTTVSIRGVSVKFPFTPYEIQKNYMEKVIDCLENQQNGILESPTGTGKTLSLLCSSLAWLEMRQTQFDEQLPNHDVSSEKLNSIERDNYECIKVPTIIYASRTHSQLRQAMQEMKRTAYNHMKACVLGSREQMCINQEVIDEKDKSHKINLCRLKVKKKQCTYFNGVERGLENPDILTLNIIDMEDIVELGRCHDFCPYYMAKELKLNADIVFMPYNYLLDPRTTKTLGVQFLNSVVILDEAHNIEKVCEDATSAQIKSTDITPCIQDITAIIDVLLGGHVPVDEEIDFTLQQLRQLNEIFFKFKKVLAHIKLPNLSLEGVSFDGDYIYEILDAAGVLI
ncbi:DEAD 2 domain containing protein [Asbolus verrucosus]|uniref:DEAD 2 domain containing protein n=1 Tax=Asbolus verrucosus TaxID=1661398 RepID=A0A482VJ80_ASBVE|nr:DEAD 2 domain containing protein [Asbolus verrucosus]